MPAYRKNPSIGRFRFLMLTASIMTFLLIVIGGVVRVTESGLGCPDWPLCYGKLIPPMRMDSILEYVHRLVASLVTPLILAAAVVAWRRFRSIPLIVRPLGSVAGLLLVEIGLGAVTVLTETPPLIVAVHLGLALTLLALLLAATVTAFRLHRGLPVPDRLDNRGGFARLSAWALAAVFVVLISGVFVAGTGAVQACFGWPLCNWQLFPVTFRGWIHMIHRFIVAAASVLMIVLALRAWLRERTRTAILPAAAVTTVLFFAQAYVGALIVTRGFPPFLLALHVAAATGVWAGMVVLVVFSGSEQESAGEATKPASISARQYARDLLALTRPVVVLLLLVTSLAGMFVAAGGWPEPGLVFWTLLGGGLAAGGAQAINQYVDRDIDPLMERTAKRPIPAGRLSPAEGLAWGLLLSVVSLFILAGQVNWLAALLALAGIIYYVLVYTLALKRTSVQNIVIGGGAGALAPVVGAAAVAGRLDLWSLFLFAIVFFWTPPHFWALALVRLRDYARAKIPVMPVARGEGVTRVQIMYYTVTLLAVSLAPAFLGMTGIVYPVAAIFLGAALFWAAWLVWRKGTNKLAWRLYRHSSLYLAFLFVALVVDVLVR